MREFVSGEGARSTISQYVQDVIFGEGIESYGLEYGSSFENMFGGFSPTVAGDVDGELLVIYASVRDPRERETEYENVFVIEPSDEPVNPTEIEHAFLHLVSPESTDEQLLPEPGSVEVGNIAIGCMIRTLLIARQYSDYVEQRYVRGNHNFMLGLTHKQGIGGQWLSEADRFRITEPRDLRRAEIAMWLSHINSTCLSLLERTDWETPANEEFVSRFELAIDKLSQKPVAES